MKLPKTKPPLAGVHLTGKQKGRCGIGCSFVAAVGLAVALGFDIVGIRWDSTHADNLIVFEKNLVD